jgi:hypothetical protein
MTGHFRGGLRSCRGRRGSERGVALIIVLIATSLMLALGTALLLSTMAEGRIASTHGVGIEAFYAADAAIERVIGEVMTAPDLNGLLSGAVTSSFADGGPAGLRTLPGGTRIDLTAFTSDLRCGKPACSDADLVAITEERPWGMNNPVWQPYAYGPLASLRPAGAIDSAMYVIVWIGDDPSENDNDPLRDGGVPAGCEPSAVPSCADGNSGRGIVTIVARAIGPDGTQRAIHATIARTGRGRILSWREVR